MSKVLDLDLDFFCWPVVRGPVKGRPSNKEHYCASGEQVREFLENQCGLSRDHKLPGHLCDTHDKAFDAWRLWRTRNLIDPVFDVHHVDAHSDLSFGDGSWAYVLTKLLALPVDKRSTPKRGLHRLNEGTYLTYAIANRWISSLSYVYPTCSWDEYNARRSEHFTRLPPDLNRFLFRDQDLRSGYIELLQLTEEGKNQLMFGGQPVPLSVEPATPIAMISANDFTEANFTHIILAHSEKFCPDVADDLMPIVQDYFYESP